MTREDIIRMADEAGIYMESGNDHWYYELERFAALIAAAERERVTFELVNEAQRAIQEAVWAERDECAKSCLNVEVSGHTFNAGAAPMEFAYQVATATAFDCAAAIRTRGEK